MLARLGAVLVVLAASAAGYYAGFLQADAATKLVTPDEVNNVEVYSKAKPAVVTVDVTFPDQALQPGESNRLLSTGFFVSANEVVTNYHAIAGAQEFHVLLASDPGLDVALLEVKGARAPAVLRFGSSDALLPGQRLIVIGSPAGNPNTISVGVFGSFNRIEPPVDNIGTEIPRMILTDANIQPGNSGGPVLDSKGEVIGVVDANLQNAVGSGGVIGLAIPGSMVAQSVSDLRNFGVSQRGNLGAKLADLASIDPVFLRAVGLSSTAGALVDEVEPGSPAETAGLRGSVRNRDGKLAELGDIILKVNDTTVADRYGVLQEVAKARPGKVVTLRVWRNKAPVTVKVTIKARPKT
ncbi:MAG TPA: trypsin-like peptidase domain-containing protein [Deinococcales bacterium]|nr:trypsin-like peptidase domain-containing protein [Deinococcales bacterium]